MGITQSIDDTTSTALLHGMTSSLFSKHTYEPRLELELQVWQHMKGYQGEVEYYFVGGGNVHGGMCLRKTDAERTVKIELVHRSATSAEKGVWFVTCRMADEWKPPSAPNQVSKEVNWHMATVIGACSKLAEHFKSNHELYSNEHWKEVIKECIRNNLPTETARNPETLEDLYGSVQTFGLSLALRNNNIRILDM